VFVGIGNPLRGDDAFGPELVSRIQGKVRAVCLDVGTAPESYAGKIAREKPGTIVLVDAVHLGKAPGAYELLEKDDILETGFTTHDLSPHLLIDYLEKETGAAVYLLAAQPETLEMGSEMSGPVRETLDRLVDRILARDLTEALNA